MSKKPRLFHRRQKRDLPNLYVIQFIEGRYASGHFGPHRWELLTELPEVSYAVINFAADFYGVDPEDIVDDVMPPSILDTAGVWDDAVFVSALWNEMERGQIEESPGFRTPDGAVVMDLPAVSLAYAFDPE